jgi:hypothetical protein
MRIPDLDQIARKLFEKQLILFVDSGMSAGCYPTWGTLLQELINEHLEGEAKAEALEMLAAGQYLNAAWVIQNVIGKDQVAGAALGQVRASILRQCGSPLPALNGIPFLPILTTNYDHFLNHVEGFTHLNQDDEIGAVLRKPRVLKLHGDQSKPKTMALTSQDFPATKFDAPLPHLM